jgi:NTP pyrophosphatase (non-canonical NTP hydrolase)
MTTHGSIYIDDGAEDEEKEHRMQNPTVSKALEDVLAERARQDAKWGEQNLDPSLYLTILGEEFGETCQAVLEARFGKGTLDHLRLEAVQTAAVALAFVECLDRNKWRWSTP